MNLLIGWNAWGVLEYLMTGEKIENTYWQFKDQYYKDFTPGWLCEPFKFYEGQKVDKVFMPTAMSKKDIEFVASLNAEMYYLEEGEYDYVKYPKEDKHYNIPLYTMNPDKIANKEVFSEVKKLHLTEEISKKFCEMYDVWLPKDVYDIILYTDPLEQDFGIKNVKEKVEKYMNEHHKGKRILVKAHPRDNTSWSWDMCSHRIPAQLLLSRNVIHVFMYKTTVMRYLTNNNIYEFINI